MPNLTQTLDKDNASVFVLALHVVPTSREHSFLSLKSLMITELIITERQVRKTTNEYGLDHVGGTRCCESNESHIG